MALPRFHVDADLAGAGPLALPEPIAHHALRVLRLADGAPIVLFDGRGLGRQAVLRVAGRHASADLGPILAEDAELAGRITLVQGLAGGDKMTLIIEKAVELGVQEIVPIAAQRSVLRLSDEREAKRMTQWRRTVVAACEQCGRNRLPQIQSPVPLSGWLAARPDAPDTLALLCHPEADATLAQALAAHTGLKHLVLLVGPEGGWSEEELTLASRHGVDRVRFGTRVLRTETAGLALTAAASALLGWQEPA